MTVFSIIVPLYNKEPYIKRTIDSVIAQTYPYYELIVVDDGSKDSSVRVVGSFSDERIRLIHKENGGVSSARNRGIAEAKNEWIVFLDADDELLPHALSVLAEMVEKYPLSCYCSGDSIWEEGHNQYRKKSTKMRLCKHPFLYLWLEKIHPAPRNVAIRKTLIQRYGSYNEKMSFYEDWDFSVRMCQGGSIVYTEKFIAKYNPGPTGLSGSSHPVEKEMAYYIPEYVETASFWHKALLYENLEMEILWWQQHGNEENVKFYQDMQKKYFGGIYLVLHWIRQKMIRHGVI